MRFRLILLVAVSAAATYAALLRDERRLGIAAPAAPLPPPPDPSDHHPADPSPPVAAPLPAAVGAVEARPSTAAPLDEGRFALGGWAAAPGHSVVSAVTFHRRLPQITAARQIALELETSENVPDGGLVVLDDPGFAPDAEGFTLLLAAADPGPFSAAGTYRVIG